MLDDATDVEQRIFRQAGVAVACENVFTVLRDGLVAVHAGTVVTDQRLGHEGSGFTVGVGNVVNTVFEDLCSVCLGDQGVKLDAYFALSGGAHFVVMHFNRQAHLLHGGTHGSANVVQAVNWRDGEVAALHARPVPGIAVFEALIGCPGGFFRTNAVAGA